ncbi:Cytochrome P450 86A2 [Phytophthora cinnamomi]|uniref:Cytochrome P450 86A2 n=1 Tax=Phytophthora cinnamomi TaxID=4785 RepID=UPI00355A3931|nr:Cytochrome P450 86A2 [Phytophthora cinnamomi]
MPYLPSLIPIVGNTLALARNMGRYHEWLAENSLGRDGKPFVLHLLGKNDVMYTARPEHFEEVLKTQSGNFIKSDSVRDIFDDVLGESAVLLNGDKWLFHRKIFANLITTRALREYMTPVIQEKTLLLQHILKEKSKEQQPFDMYKLMRQFTLETITEIGFGCNLELLTTDKEHPFEVAFDDANRISSERFTKPTWLWKFQRFLNIGSERRLREAIDIIDKLTVNLIMDAMQQTKNANPDEAEERQTHKNLMTILVTRPEEITPTQVRDIVLTSLEAGRNTTSDTLAWFFHSLSHHPQVEKKLRSEILTKLPKFAESDRYVPSYEEMQDLPYLEATIREVFRLHPTVPSIPYHCHKDTVLQDGTFISAGTDVFLHLYSAGRLTSVWGSNAGDFIPERFIDEQTGNLIPAKYSSFSSGPRVCVGRNLAMLELKIAIATMMSRFHLTEEPGQEVRSILDLSLTMKNPLMMRVETINC